MFVKIKCSSLEGKNSELLHIFHGHVKLYFDCARTNNSGHFAALVLEEQLARRNVLGGLTSQYPQKIRQI